MSTVKLIDKENNELLFDNVYSWFDDTNRFQTSSNGRGVFVFVIVQHTNYFRNGVVFLIEIIYQTAQFVEDGEDVKLGHETSQITGFASCIRIYLYICSSDYLKYQLLTVSLTVFCLLFPAGRITNKTSQHWTVYQRTQWPWRLRSLPYAARGKRDSFVVVFLFLFF